MKRVFLFSFLALFMGCNIGEPVETSPKQHSKTSKNTEEFTPNTSVVSKTPWYQHPATIITGIVTSSVAIGLGVWRWVVGKQVETEDPNVWYTKANRDLLCNKYPDCEVAINNLSQYYKNEFDKLKSKKNINRVFHMAIVHSTNINDVIAFFDGIRNVDDNWHTQMDQISDLGLLYILNTFTYSTNNTKSALKEYLANKQLIDATLQALDPAKQLFFAKLPYFYQPLGTLASLSNALEVYAKNLSHQPNFAAEFWDNSRYNDEQRKALLFNQGRWYFEEDEKRFCAGVDQSICDSFKQMMTTILAPDYDCKEQLDRLNTKQKRRLLNLVTLNKNEPQLDTLLHGLREAQLAKIQDEFYAQFDSLSDEFLIDILSKWGDTFKNAWKARTFN